MGRLSLQAPWTIPYVFGEYPKATFWESSPVPPDIQILCMRWPSHLMATSSLLVLLTKPCDCGTSLASQCPVAKPHSAATKDGFFRLRSHPMANGSCQDRRISR